MNRIQITSPKDIATLLSKWSRKREENFLEVTLDGGHVVIKVHHISKEIANKTIVHPRECFYPAIKDNAVALVFAHNHPSGRVLPSPEDDDIFERLKMAGDILGFHILDNLIISKYGFYSYRQEGRYKDYSNNELKNYAELLAADRR